MKIISVTDENALSQAAQILASGGVILYPTDTLYGLGADALSDEAVAKIYAIKGRDENKPIHCIVADMQMAARFGEVNELAVKLTEKFLPGPLTLILKKKSEIDTGLPAQAGIGRGMTTIGIRIPDNEFCLALAREFNKPFTTTSANKAGERSERSIDAIVAQLGESAGMIDLAIDADELPERLPSTVVDVSSGEIVILREGAIPASDIFF